jgi:hypothetical protein
MILVVFDYFMIFPLWSSEFTSLGFPGPDRAIKTFLESHNGNHDDLVLRYLLFFANLFRTAKSELMGWQWDLSDNRSPAAVWRTTLEDKSFRDKYYKQATDISVSVWSVRVERRYLTH